MLQILTPGLCLESLGSSCLPKKTRLETYEITVYVNSTPYCTSIELEHHRGPCRCECSLGGHSCSPRQQFSPDSCSCHCLPHLTRDKLACLNSSSHSWDDKECQCVCRNTNTCQQGQVFSTESCSCQAVSRGQCEVGGVSLNTHRVYMINIVLMGVLVSQDKSGL